MLDLSRLDEAIRYEGGISRRLLLAYGAALAGIHTLGLHAEDKLPKKGKFDSSPFKLGVASGDPRAESVVIWSRLAPKPLQADGDGGMKRDDVEVDWLVANDDKMKDVVQKGSFVAKPSLGHSVHVVVNGLKPDRWYSYQFRCGGYESVVGRTRTMPDPETMPARLRLAFASCQNFEDGYFTAYEHMAKDNLDLVIHLGDYIYEFGARKNRVRVHEGERCETLKDYRLRYSQYRHDADLRHMHSLCPWLVTWDDHEVEGNYANDVSKFKDVKPGAFLKKRAHAYQAYYEMMPLRPRSVPDGPDLLLYRSVTFGKLASFRLLDTRQYRTNQPNGDEKAELNAAATRETNTILGAKQLKWLEERLLKSQTAWNVLAQQVMIGMVDLHNDQKYSMDKWTGYFHERKKLMEFLANHKVRNPVVLTGDIHSNWVNELRVDDRKQEGSPVAVEFVGTSISSGDNGKPIDPARLARLQKTNPFVKFHNDERGYVRCTVTPEKWTTDFQVVSDVTKPNGKVTTRATFVVQEGSPGVKR